MKNNSKALGYLQAFDESGEWARVSRLYMIQTCTYLYSSNET